MEKTVNEMHIEVLESHIKKVTDEIVKNELRICKESDLNTNTMIAIQKKQADLGHLIQWLNAIVKSRQELPKIVKP